MTLYSYNVIADTSLQKRSLKEKNFYSKRSLVYFEALAIYF